MHPEFDTVLVVDFGAQYAQLIARRVRECQVYSEIVPASMPGAQVLARKPKAIILSGGPASVYAPGAPPLPGGLLESGVPILGICYGFQLMVSGLGGEVTRTGTGESGATRLELLPAVGDTVEVNGQRLTVTEMDARRIARVRVGPASADGQADPAGTVAEDAARATPPG